MVKRALAFPDPGDGRVRILFTVHGDERLWEPDKNILDAMDVFQGLGMSCGRLSWAERWWASTAKNEPLTGDPYGESESLPEAIFTAACQAVTQD